MSKFILHKIALFSYFQMSAYRRSRSRKTRRKRRKCPIDCSWLKPLNMTFYMNICFVYLWNQFILAFTTNLCIHVCVQLLRSPRKWQTFKWKIFWWTTFMILIGCNKINQTYCPCVDVCSSKFVTLNSKNKSDRAIYSTD